MALSTEQRSKLIQGFGAIFTTLDETFLGLGAFIQTVIAAFYNAKNDLIGISHFNFDPKFKTRVMSLPRAEAGVQELWATIRLDLLGKYQEIVFAVQQLQETFHADELSLENDPQGQINGLAKAAVSLNHVKGFLSQLGNLISNVANLLDIINDIKHRIETLDDLFLTQGAPKITVDEHYRKRQRS